MRIAIVISSLLVLPACDTHDKSIGSELFGGTTGSVDGTANPGMSGNVPGGNEDDTGGTGESVDVDLTAVSAALLADGLCPWPFDQSPGMTLRFTNSPMLCVSDLPEHPHESDAAYVDLYLPSSEPGTYDASTTTIEAVNNVIESTGGGGGASGPLPGGTIEITEIGAEQVTGTLTDIQIFGIDNLRFDINGPFTAVRCAPAQWLDVAVDPRTHEPEGSFDPACTLPDPD